MLVTINNSHLFSVWHGTGQEGEKKSIQSISVFHEINVFPSLFLKTVGCQNLKLKTQQYVCVSMPLGMEI